MPEGLIVTQSKSLYFDGPINTSMNIFPLRAVSFQLPSTDMESIAYIKVLDNTLSSSSLNGWLGWAYEKIKGLDHNYYLYDLLLFIQYSWTFLSFFIWLFVFAGWSYFCLINAFALLYGIMQKSKGRFAMIEGYMRGVFYGLLFPVKVFVFCINLILNLLKIVIPF